MDVKKLEFASQSCKRNNIITANVSLGMARIYEFKKDYQGALNILVKSAEDLGKVEGDERDQKGLVNLNLKIADILRAGKKEIDAINFYVKAADAMPENMSLQSELFNELFTMNAYQKAAFLAERIKNEKINNPELLLKMSIAYKQVGQSLSAQEFKARGMAAFDTLEPEIKKSIEPRIKELLGFQENMKGQMVETLDKTTTPGALPSRMPASVPAQK